jgi:hypothetical protein
MHSLGALTRFPEDHTPSRVRGLVTLRRQYLVIVAASCQPYATTSNCSASADQPNNEHAPTFVSHGTVRCLAREPSGHGVFLRQTPVDVALQEQVSG